MRNLIYIILVTSIISCCRNVSDEYVEFKIIELIEGKYYKTNAELIDKPMFCASLSYYGIPFKFTNNQVFVKKQDIESDINLFRNIQIKSVDSVWLKEHLLEKTAIKYSTPH